jgi:quercetin dioxygenase-like cupin family protein
MDRESFKDALLRAGYEEITINTTPGERHNPEHSHPYDVRVMVLSGSLTLTWRGQIKTFRSGDTFTMERGCPHAESYGLEGAVTLSGRMH